MSTPKPDTPEESAMPVTKDAAPEDPNAVANTWRVAIAPDGSQYLVGPPLGEADAEVAPARLVPEGSRLAEPRNAP